MNTSYSPVYLKKQLPAIEKQIREVMEKLNIERMPCNSEIIQVTGSHSLDLKIQRSGGYVQWAERLNIPAKNEADNINDNYVRDLDSIKEKILSQKDSMTPLTAVAAQSNMSMLTLWNTSRKRHTAGLMGRKIKTAEEMEQYVDDFMLFCAENNLRPNFQKLAIWLDYTEGKLKAIMQNCNDDRSGILQKAMSLFDEILSENIGNTTTPTGSIFLAKARHGWIEAEKDKTINVNIQAPMNRFTFDVDDFVDEVVEILPEMIESGE